jgi:hypothetical protein
MASQHHDDYDEKYTDPELRRRLKDEIMAGDKGGEPGEWSARKSQLLVQAYEKHGGGYKHKAKDATQRSLEEWQTQDGDERARHGDTTERYLPRAVWEKLSPEERKQAERTKERGSREGQQHIEWPAAVKRAMEAYEREQHGQQRGDTDEHEPSKQELLERARELGVEGRSTMNKEQLSKAIGEAERT